LLCSLVRGDLTALKSGVQDYLVKEEINSRLLARSLRYARERKSLDQLKEEFISIASHELRTPMAVIDGSLKNLQDGLAGELNEKQKRIVNMACSNVRRLIGLMENLLSIARFQSGRSEIKAKELDITKFLDEIASDHCKLIKEHDLKLTRDLPSVLPPVYADEDMIMEVMNNLCSNAIRYAKGEVVVRAKAIETKGVPFVQISIGNDGPPIDQKDREKLFQKFVQINRSEGGTGYKGTGLGLAICKEIIDRHGGSIWVENERRDGHESLFFSFTLPCRNTPSSSPPTETN
jgi:signal transduction histidine kinase